MLFATRAPAASAVNPSVEGKGRSKRRFFIPFFPVFFFFHLRFLDIFKRNTGKVMLLPRLFLNLFEVFEIFSDIMSVCCGQKGNESREDGIEKKWSKNAPYFARP